MSFYNPMMKGPDLGGGIQDALMQFMQMMMMKKMMGGDPQQQSQQVPTPAPQGGGQGVMDNPMQSIVGQAPNQFPDSQARSYQPQGGMPPQPTMGAGPPGMGQAGMAGQMGSQIPMQLMQALKDNPQLLQWIMQTLRGGAGGM